MIKENSFGLLIDLCLMISSVNSHILKFLRVQLRLFGIESITKRGMFHHRLLIWGDTFGCLQKPPLWLSLERRKSRKTKVKVFDSGREQLKTFCDLGLPFFAGTCKTTVSFTCSRVPCGLMCLYVFGSLSGHSPFGWLGEMQTHPMLSEEMGIDLKNDSPNSGLRTTLVTT